MSTNFYEGQVGGQLSGDVVKRTISTLENDKDSDSEYRFMCTWILSKKFNCVNARKMYLDFVESWHYLLSSNNLMNKKVRVVVGL